MRWLIAIVLAVTSSFAFAEGRLYGELHLAATGVKNGELDFYPVLGGVTVGAYVLPNIGIELFADAGLSADKDEGFEMNIDQAFGIAARFQSPPRRGLQGYIVLGMVNYTLDQSSNASASVSATSINGDFSGARVSVGVMQRLKRMPNLQVSFEYRHYNADEPLRVDALVLGLRVNSQ